MRKILCLLVALMMALGCLTEGLAATKLTDVRCTEDQFSTKVPAGTTAEYVKNTGFQLSVGKAGAIPYVIIMRRPTKFNNPKSYLNNTYREYMEEQYGDNYRGMSSATTMEIGGKKLLGARYNYMVQKNEVCLLKLIEVRDDGDVEYTVKYVKGKDQDVMAVADAAIRYYTPDAQKTASQSTSTKKTTTGGSTATASSGGVLKPMAVSGGIDTQSGQYWVRITDMNRVESGGYFTAKLYTEDHYPAKSIKALKAGSKVQVNGKVYTVSKVVLHEEDTYEIYVREDFDGYIVFQPEDENTYYGVVNDRTCCTYAGDLKISLPLANDFRFVWLAEEESDQQVYDGEGFAGLLMRHGSENDFLIQYNTIIMFQDGMAMLIVHRDYPGEEDY